MVALKIEDFAGMIPRRSDRLLPETFAALAENCKLLSGELRAFNDPLPGEIFDPGYTVRRVFRIPDSPDDRWLTWDDQLVSIYPGPLVNDAYDRFYWTGDGAPKMSTLTEIAAATAPRALGIVGPTTGMTVTPDGSGAAGNETRAYVYTFVTDLGEESMPSDPTTATGKADDSWDLASIDVSPDSRVVSRRIYRTVSGAASVDYRFVADIADNTTTTYSDTTQDVSSNSTLESTSWAPPPSDLSSLRLMPNGFFVGFSGRDLYFSEAYRPHAWPAEYVLSTDDTIIGLGTIGSTCAVITEASVYVATGTQPAAMSFRKLDIQEPIVSSTSIVELPVGVAYASRNGLVLVTPTGAELVTDVLLTRDQWTQRYNPALIKGVLYRDDQYLGMFGSKSGFLLDLTEQRRSLVDLEVSFDVDGVSRDRYTGDVYFLSDNQVFTFDPSTTQPSYYEWWSKQFDINTPINLGAAHLKFDTTRAEEITALYNLYSNYNTARIGVSLQTLNSHVINAVHSPDLGLEDLNRLNVKAPIGGTPLRDISLLEDPEFAVTLFIYGDGELRHSKTVEAPGILRLPSGYKASLWQFRVVGNMRFFSMSFAETKLELMKV